jgi:hypothetical protein
MGVYHVGVRYQVGPCVSALDAHLALAARPDGSAIVPASGLSTAALVPSVPPTKIYDLKGGEKTSLQCITQLDGHFRLDLTKIDVRCFRMCTAALTLPYVGLSGAQSSVQERLRGQESLRRGVDLLAAYLHLLQGTRDCGVR